MSPLAEALHFQSQIQLCLGLALTVGAICAGQLARGLLANAEAEQEFLAGMVLALSALTLGIGALATLAQSDLWLGLISPEHLVELYK